jgi:hypothetical protein
MASDLGSDGNHASIKQCNVALLASFHRLITGQPPPTAAQATDSSALQTPTLGSAVNIRQLGRLSHVAGFPHPDVSFAIRALSEVPQNWNPHRNDVPKISSHVYSTGRAGLTMCIMTRRNRRRLLFVPRSAKKMGCCCGRLAYLNLLVLHGVAAALPGRI